MGETLVMFCSGDRGQRDMIMKKEKDAKRRGERNVRAKIWGKPSSPTSVAGSTLSTSLAFTFTLSLFSCQWYLHNQPWWMEFSRRKHSSRADSNICEKWVLVMHNVATAKAHDQAPGVSAHTIHINQNCTAD